MYLFFPFPFFQYYYNFTHKLWKIQEQEKVYRSEKKIIEDLNIVNILENVFYSCLCIFSPPLCCISEELLKLSIHTTGDFLQDQLESLLLQRKTFILIRHFEFACMFSSYSSGFILFSPFIIAYSFLNVHPLISWRSCFHTPLFRTPHRTSRFSLVRQNLFKGVRLLLSCLTLGQGELHPAQYKQGVQNIPSSVHFYSDNFPSSTKY